MAPLTKLLRKRSEWKLDDEPEAAFETIKDILTTKPLLVYPDFRLPFRFVTDTSKVGLGACLMQAQGAGWKPIAYASKVKSITDSNYGITELGFLAVVWAIKLFRPYLYGRRLMIGTDNSALRWLMQSPNLTGKLHRRVLTLQEYEFDVQYRPGCTNAVVDALSRVPAIVLAATGRRRRWIRQIAAAAERDSSAMSRGDASVLNHEDDGMAVIMNLGRVLTSLRSSRGSLRVW
ncbi:unnamed protein product [Phytophthora fragariaefolia]|uniref:Unnamed protein product n=1 Tax=Phytophthora fragariaefolia TaxID=1490495 RepID=A0A9W6YH03_9STRA|nr:unnamed protein product [Phytophthora fragariaefolia]